MSYILAAIPSRPRSRLGFVRCRTLLMATALGELACLDQPLAL
jgi:hypothetical protein